MDRQGRLTARLIPQLLSLAFSVGAAVAIADPQKMIGDTQRMLIEAQSFSIPSGGKAQPRAMCLDAASHSPTPATRFVFAPTSLGDIQVSVPGGKQMTLQQAIDRHIVEVRGTQGYSSVEFRNLLPSGEIKVVVQRNSVVAPDKSYRTGDLRGLPELESRKLTSQAALWQSRAVQSGQAATPAVVEPQSSTPAQEAPRN
jgi:hypothetical protein